MLYFIRRRKLAFYQIFEIVCSLSQAERCVKRERHCYGVAYDVIEFDWFICDMVRFGWLVGCMKISFSQVQIENSPSVIEFLQKQKRTFFRVYIASSKQLQLGAFSKVMEIKPSTTSRICLVSDSSNSPHVWMSYLNTKNILHCFVIFYVCSKGAISEELLGSF